MQLIDGKKIADEILETLKSEIELTHAKPCLAIVLVGNDESSKIYVRNKIKAAEKVGIETKLLTFDAAVDEKTLCQEINTLNKNKHITGIIVQQPLPPQISLDKVLTQISPLKDVDGFGIHNMGLLCLNLGKGIIAATPKGVLRLLQATGVNLAGKHAVIIGRSKIVGRPLAALLLNHDCTVTVTHTKTLNLPHVVKTADIVVAACGAPKLVKKEWVKKGAIVIDVGINRVDGKLCGDVDFENVAPLCSYISPVPGGVGPMTVAMLLENTYQSYFAQRRED